MRNINYPVTLALIGINTLVFIVLAVELKSLSMESALAVISILKAGGNLNPLTLGGEPWRVITCVFLHFGIFHILVNMYALWGLGRLLEPAIGSLRFVLLYFICGIAASIASLLFNVMVISAGASGAIFGLYGYQLGAEFIGSFHDREKLTKVLINFGAFVVINTIIAGQLNVDVSGHIGGALAGLAIAFCHFKLKVLRQSPGMAAVLVVLPVAMFFIPQNQVRFFNLFQKVIAQDDITSKLFTTGVSLSDSLLKIQDQWRAIGNELHTLPSIPSELKGDSVIISNYVALRVKETGYRVHLIQESYIYEDSVEVLAKQFSALPHVQHTYSYRLPEEAQASDENKLSEQSFIALDTILVYYDEDWKEMDGKEGSSFYRIGTKDSLGRWQGKVRDYFSDGQIQMKGSYKDGLRNGVFIYYSDHHTYSSAGRYEKERLAGKWQYFHWNGSLESEMLHEPEFFVRDVWDSLGNLQVSNGEGDYKKWFPNGALAEQGSYVRGKRDGYWYGYHPDGQPHYKELYRRNALVSGVSIDVNGKRYVYDQYSELAFPVEGMKKYNGYLQQNKAMLNGQPHGVVKVLFTVGTDGSLWDFAILQSLSKQCDNEAMRLVREGPPWRPAYRHGYRKVQSQGYVEVSF
jgi:membrane associated rhomboid family serine protease/antitoxin component YwqK of YwqJK toxin-antitoxin module